MKKERIAIYLSAFEEFYGMNDPASQGEFLSVFLGMEGKDPDGDVLNAFSKRFDGKMSIFPFSESKLGEASNVVNKHGKAGLNVDFGPIKTVGPRRVSIEVGYFAHPTFSGLTIYLLEKKGGRWRIVEKQRGPQT